MPIDPSKLRVFRIIHFQNLEHILQHGVHYRNNPSFPANYVDIGNPEIINSRDEIPVLCFPGTMVNDYVPFYFSVRTPMLFNIHTGYGLGKKHEQHEIIYLCCNVGQITESDLQWCFTDGNAARKISRFYNNVKDLDNLDWHSIRTTDFRDDNADLDTDRKRNHLPIEYIQNIVVYNKIRHDYVTDLVERHNRKITIEINPDNKFYF